MRLSILLTAIFAVHHVALHSGLYSTSRCSPVGILALSCQDAGARTHMRAPETAHVHADGVPPRVRQELPPYEGADNALDAAPAAEGETDDASDTMDAGESAGESAAEIVGLHVEETAGKASGETAGEPMDVDDDGGAAVSSTTALHALHAMSHPLPSPSAHAAGHTHDGAQGTAARAPTARVCHARDRGTTPGQVAAARPDSVASVAGTPTADAGANDAPFDATPKRAVTWGEHVPLVDALRAAAAAMRALRPPSACAHGPGRHCGIVADFPLQSAWKPADIAERAQWFYNCRSFPNSSFPAGVEPDRASTDRASVREHAFRIYDATQAWRGRAYSQWGAHAGPWIENYWIESFARPVIRLHNPPSCSDSTAMCRNKAYAPVLPQRSSTWLTLLPDAWRARFPTSESVQGVIASVEPFDIDLFVPMVPLFVQWTDIQSHPDFDAQQAQPLAQFLVQQLRTDIMYVTVVQHSSGIYLERLYQAEARDRLANILILSSGGVGNVPLPLLGREWPLMAAPEMGHREFDVGFIGALRKGARAHALDWLRLGAKMKPHLKLDVRTDLLGADEWVQSMCNARLEFAPRGTGATSFRLYEIIQMGLIPVHVYDEPWLPYRSSDWDAWDQTRRAAGVPLTGMRSPTSRAVDLWDEIAFTVHVSDVSDWIINVLPQLLADSTRLDRMTVRIADIRDEYFTYAGVLSHVFKFLSDPAASALRCVPRVTAIRR